MNDSKELTISSLFPLAKKHIPSVTTLEDAKSAVRDIFDDIRGCAKGSEIKRLSDSSGALSKIELSERVYSDIECGIHVKASKELGWDKDLEDL